MPARQSVQQATRGGVVLAKRGHAHLAESGGEHGVCRGRSTQGSPPSDRWFWLIVGDVHATARLTYFPNLFPSIFILQKL